MSNQQPVFVPNKMYDLEEIEGMVITHHMIDQEGMQEFLQAQIGYMNMTIQAAITGTAPDWSNITDQRRMIISNLVLLEDVLGDYENGIKLFFNIGRVNISEYKSISLGRCKAGWERGKKH